VAVLAFASRVRPALFLASWAVLPVLAVFVVSNVGQSYWMARYLLPVLPAFALLAGAAVTALLKRQVLLAVAVLAIAALGVQDQRAIRQVGAHDAWNYPDGGNPPLFYSAAAEQIAEHYQPGDGVMYVHRQDYWLLDIGLAYHLQGRPQPADIMVEQSALQRADFWPVECTDVAACVGDTPRIWVVAASVVYGDDIKSLEPDKLAVLQSGYHKVNDYSVQGIAVQLWARNS
jgi:mannosyltransferase